MYRIEKSFNISMAHRLTNHSGLCFYPHGHNYMIYIGLKSKKLNENNMVMDFGDLKTIINYILNAWDHGMMLNKNDPINKRLIDGLPPELRDNIINFHGNPTAEYMAEVLYKMISGKIKNYNFENKIYKDNEVCLDYVKIYETEKSNATYSEE